MKFQTSLWIGFTALLALFFIIQSNSVTASLQQDSKAFPEIIQLPTGFAPEGIATGKGTTFYVGSLQGGAIYQGDLRTGEGDILIPAHEGNMAVGLDVDERNNYLYVCGGRSGEARVYDINSGKIQKTYTLSSAEDTFINDVIVTKDAAYLTNSFQHVIYKLPLGKNGELPEEDEVNGIQLNESYETVDGFNTNGIEATPDGKMLIIVNSSTGKLYRIERGGNTKKTDTWNINQIDLGTENMKTGDGLLLDGQTLFVVQNRRNQIAEVDLSQNWSSADIDEYITHDAFDVPTTVAMHGDFLYAVNAKFGTDAKGTDYEVVKVRK